SGASSSFSSSRAQPRPVRRAATAPARAPTRRAGKSRHRRASVSCGPRSELRADRKERELVVGLSQTSREDPDGVPKYVAREVHAQEQEIGEAISRNGEETAPLVDDGVGRSRR